MSFNEPQHHARSIAARTAAFYDRCVPEYIQAFFEDPLDWGWTETFLDLLPAGAAILDVGCGPGSLAALMSRKGARVLGIDISKAMVDAARELVPAASFRVMDMNELDLPESSFDGVLAAYSFLHVPSARASDVLRRFRRVLKADGVLAMMLKEGSGEHWLPSSLIRGQTCYAQLWGKQDIGETLVAAGFDTPDIRSADAAFPEEFQYPRLFIIARRSAMRP